MKELLNIIELINSFNKKFREVKNINNKDRIKLTQEFINDCEKLNKKKHD